MRYLREKLLMSNTEILFFGTVLLLNFANVILHLGVCLRWWPNL